MDFSKSISYYCEESCKIEHGGDKYLCHLLEEIYKVECGQVSVTKQMW